jgi:phosphoribosylglycinamide formyltransferase-1
MNIGIISSGGGGAFQAFWEILKKNNKEFNFFIITDRENRILDFAKIKSIPFKIIEAQDNEDFSQKAKSQLGSWGGVDLVFLFYTKLVTKSLFNTYPVFNLHPSLLPAFQGFNPIKKALEKEVKFTGTTLHLIDEQADNGPIIAQAVVPVHKNSSEVELEKISFIHKVYLMLLLVDLYENDAIEITGSKITLDTSQFPPTKEINPSLKNNDFLNDVIELDRNNGSNFFQND